MAVVLEGFDLVSQLTPEQQQLQNGAIDFARSELNDDIIRDRDEVFSHEGWKACARFGVQGLPVPAEYGGMDRHHRSDRRDGRAGLRHPRSGVALLAQCPLVDQHYARPLLWHRGTTQEISSWTSQRLLDRRQRRFRAGRWLGRVRHAHARRKKEIITCSTGPRPLSATRPLRISL